ncbi:hypothetical protein L3Q82_011085 [Scortum barcoo]|uniref:Uncharacterized protein n=1 Tax=Scortum barcoo TaxID=214431 RepID=A0ACB8W8C8_9TELE|nr:hypothetical protein L3Q82_011085 [Scortum barcoo]
MGEYTLEVTTGGMLHAGTADNLYVTLIGTERQSEFTELINFGLAGQTGKVGSYSVTTLFSLGCLLLLKLEKDPFQESQQNTWFCSKIVTRTPEGDEILFPCHRWLSRGEFVLLRGGRATKAFEDLHPRLVEERKKELVQQKLTYKWGEYANGMSYILNIKDPKAVPREISFSFSKGFQLKYASEARTAELTQRGLTNSTEQWESFEAMKGFSWFEKSPITQYVSQHWKDDDFFGYQFLNGANPFVIQRCSKLPSNFPVAEEMVKPFLASESSLTEEMKKGNIFISDYKIMEGLRTRVIDGEQTALTAALCLLYLNPEKKLLPIAIQLGQQPSEKNPIFLPSDSDSDWLLAKIYLKHADSLHAVWISHLQNTHLLGEVFAMSTIRNLPMIHPLHTSHNKLFVFQLSLEADASIELLRRRLSQTTYTSLCLPEDIAARGLESIPNFYYRDDALRLWSIINSFVKKMVAYYYPSDSEVSEDLELQEWINDIFYYGFLGNVDSGIPSSFQTVEELIKFVTMVIFTSSVQHAAVNNPQVPLGTYPMQRFDEPAVLQMIKDFQAELSSLSTGSVINPQPFLQTGVYTVKTSSSLGKLLLVKVEKEPYFLLPENVWYCSKIMVTTPEGDVLLFPCYRWISRGELVELRGGRAMKVFEEDHPVLIDHREKELIFQKSLYQWEITRSRLPQMSTFKDISELPAEIRFSMSKSMELLFTKATTVAELMFKGLAGSTKNWESIEDIKKILWYKKTAMSEYVTEHWKEDDFYGSQFLNGINPNMIKRCSELPPNFPVKEEMVKPFLEKGSSLQREMEKGNIFLCDFKRLDGLVAKVYDGEPLPVTSGFCLFYVNPEKKLMPIAIQLSQQPSEQNPIFLPSDSETDWLLAKLFIKNADFMLHQSVYHFLGTHCLAEVYTVATLRSLPVIHPLYKLLIPHVHYTLHINTKARKSIFGPEGILNKSSLGLDGMTELMRRSFSEMTYSSLCLPDNITARGLESVPNFYYRDDGLKLWSIINSFVRAVVKYYYPSDSDVCKDTELQEWINEIFTHGFLGNKALGLPTCFKTAEEVIKFITMVIFTVTAQHAAVNNGQFDYHSWIPNGSLLLRKPPPTTKGQSSMKTILETFPDVGQTVSFVAMSWILSANYSDVILLGQYPEEQFDEPAPKQMMKKFQAKLSHLSEAIKARNSQLEVPYKYLDPTLIENSITI